MRDFRLFKHSSGAYELLPRGWSFWALLFHVFWAIGNGVFLRYAKFFIPALIATVIGALLLAFETYESVAFIVIDISALYFTAFSIYFSFVAFEWRADLLRHNGYEHIATIRAWTGRQALRKWSLSDEADREVGQS